MVKAHLWLRSVQLCSLLALLVLDEAASFALAGTSSAATSGGGREQQGSPTLRRLAMVGGAFTRSKLLRTGGTVVAGGIGLGFLRQKMFIGPSFNKQVDLQGKTVIITGANTGLGKETAKQLAAFGADVILACRSEAKGNAAAAEIRSDIGPKALVEAMTLDLSSLASVDAFAAQLAERRSKVDILVNNAGVMAVPTRETTKDGFELQLGINHLGHFRLTSRLMPLLRKADKPRVVNLSSSAHTMVSGFDFSDAQLERGYKAWPAYGQSKLANVYFTTELARRYGDDGIFTTAVHPGVCRTELGRYIIGEKPNPLLVPALALLIPFTKSPKEGAQTSIFCAAEPDLPARSGNGMYFADLKESKTSAAAKDAAAAKRLWELSEQLVGAF